MSTESSPSTDPAAQGGLEAPGLYAAYEEHAKTLRTWLVAYGIGAPVLFVSQDALWARIAASGSVRTIAGAFLWGVALQVLLAAINKNAMWACYFGDKHVPYRSTKRYKLAMWVSEQYSIDFVADVATMVLFAWATYQCFVALVAGAA
jgi:hypothetical protein